MNLRAKFVFSIGLLSLLWLVLPGSLRANTVYTYTSNPYNSCSGTYAPSGINNVCSQPYALSLTLETTLSVRGFASNTTRYPAPSKALKVILDILYQYVIIDV